MNDPWEISAQLSARRKELGMSLAQLAKRANTSPATLSRYEGGWTRFEVYTLRKLASALGCRLVVRLEPKEKSSAQVGVSEVVGRIGRLFWDQQLTTVHLERHPQWVIGRVLEYGSLDDVELLVRLLGKAAFLRHVRDLRFETEKTRTFWQSILEREEMACTNESFPKEAATFWPPSRA